MPFAETSSILKLLPLPVLPRVMTSTHVVQREHLNVSTLAGKELLDEYVDSLDDVEEVEDIESTESSFLRFGCDIMTIGSMTAKETLCDCMDDCGVARCV